MRYPASSTFGPRRTGAPHRYRPAMRRRARHSQPSALRVALAPVLIVALMVSMWAIAFELERRARQPDFGAVQDAMLAERYDQALELLNQYRPRNLAEEVRLRKARLHCFVEQEQHGKAVSQLRWLISHDDTNAAPYHLRLGDILIELGEDDTAQFHYRKAAELNARDAPALIPSRNGR